MRPNQYTIVTYFLFLVCHLGFEASGQLGFPLEIKKSEEYEDRQLRSEKSDQGKFRLPKRLIQNTVTHYNYFFNANNKLNEVLERAKLAHQDDYAQLLPFYNYTLDITARDSIQLDSVVYKASTGIALHDLRNDWIDNLYLLWGASYYLQKKFDSAYLMFQFINYAFAPKEKDGYFLTIGSSMDGNQAYSISTKEKKGLPRKLLSEPPSRNEAFIWQIRNFLVQDQLAEASSLVVTLRNDPNFPKRLQPDLHEVQALLFYKQTIWDSAAVHLVQALDNATNLQEKARWEYLAAQLFEMSGNKKEADKYYTKVSNHTTDLVLDIYARLAAVRVNKATGENSIEKNVAELMRMAKRDKYEDYRDIIYYMAAQMQLEGNNIDAAMALLQKSTQYASNNPGQRNKAFLQLAEIAFDRGEYRKAHDFYDSIKMNDPALKNIEQITARKKVLGNVINNLNIAERIDSLQRIAAMSEDDRKDFVKKLVKDLRKQQGLKDDPVSVGPGFSTPTLFPSVNPKGEWYFYNAAFRTKGQADFKAKWGNRPNVDNWRRTGAGIGSTVSNNPSGITNPTGSPNPGGSLTFDDLYNTLPLTPEQMQQTNDSLQDAWFNLGKIYVQDIENCNSGTEMLEKIRTRFPEFSKMDEVLFNLYYCYNKNGETTKAATIKRLMSEKYPSSNLNTIIATGRDPNITASQVATKTYETIYDLFIEGKFQQAVDMKKEADQKYGKSYWTPQLLYIEAVYYIKQRDDGAAKQVLTNIIAGFPASPLASKAKALLSVVNRRAEIEAELTKLQVTRKEDPIITNPVPVTQQPKPVTNDPVKADNPPVTKPEVTTNQKPKQDSIKTNVPAVVNNTAYRFEASEQHYVGLVLNKIDPVFMNEAKNAFNRFHNETFPAKKYQTVLYDINAENKLMVISSFANADEAVKYIDAVKPRTGPEILPWLRGGKYSFVILLPSNVGVLQQLQDFEAYKAFLNQYFPGKF